MANLTITVDEDVLRRARIRALERGVSVNTMLARYLEVLAGDDPGSAALRSVVRIAKTSTSRSGAAGRTWTRDELHERR